MNQFASLLFASVLLLSSCKSLLPEKPAISDPKEAAKLKEMMVKQFGGDKPISNFSIHAKEMSDELEMATITFVENDKIMDQSFLVQLGDKQQPAKPSIVQSDFLLKQKKEAPVMKIKDLDFAVIAPKFQEAVNQLPAEFKDGASLNNWHFYPVKNGKMTYNFEVHATKKGESSSMQGRRIVTNYYEFDFAVDEKGTVTMKD